MDYQYSIIYIYNLEFIHHLHILSSWRIGKHRCGLLIVMLIIMKAVVMTLFTISERTHILRRHHDDNNDDRVKQRRRVIRGPSPRDGTQAYL